MSDELVRVEIEGADELRHDLEAVGTDTPAFKRAVQQATRLVAEALRKRTPKHTGALQRSIRRYVRRDSYGWYGLVQFGKKRAYVARFLEYGWGDVRRPKPQRPRNTRVYRFIGRDGQVVFARKFTPRKIPHGPRPFIEPTTRETADTVARLLGNGYAPRLLGRGHA